MAGWSRPVGSSPLLWPTTRISTPLRLLRPTGPMEDGPPASSSCHPNCCLLANTARLSRPRPVRRQGTSSPESLVGCGGRGGGGEGEGEGDEPVCIGEEDRDS
jgi:hypothetical protein